ncbi:unnamed protein product [Amaranthus hypochondriacus]
MGKVVLYGACNSPYSKRIEIALKMKGIEYEFIEEDVKNKSEEVVKYNPVYKKIPILVHDGNPIVESLLILEYIDETWKNNPLLPIHAYQRAYARFWANFIDDKVILTLKNGLMTKGEEREKALEEVDESLKILENEMKEKKFLGGESIGFLDIVALMVAFWVPCLQEGINNNFLTYENHPSICSWIDRLLSCTLIQQNLPNRETLIAYYRARYVK